MWLITPIGFFSIVQKPEDMNSETLTIRARVRSDLEALQLRYLPELGSIKESNNTDYRFRAKASKPDVAKVMSQMVLDIDYSNFKNKVAQTQGLDRAHVYHDVWDALYTLQMDTL